MWNKIAFGILILIQLLVYPTLGNKACPCAFQFLKEVEIDLNGDGEKDKISVFDICESGEFTLKVNHHSKKGKLNDQIDGFTIIDLDKNDPQKEIALHTPGPSDDDEYLIFGFDGKSIQEIGRLSRWPTFLGNGEVLVGDWMGFWEKKDMFVLDKKSKKLKLLPQEFYFVGQKAKVKVGFPIYEKRKESKIVANLQPSETIIILLYDPSERDYLSGWYLIKTSKGLLGWARLRAFSEKVEGLPWAD